MKLIKIIFFSIAFHFFTPVNSYAVIQTCEKPQSEISRGSHNNGVNLFLGIAFVALGIYPFVKGIILWQAAENIVAVAFGVLTFGVGALLLLMGFSALMSYFFDKNRRYRRY